ncbi:zinc finger CCCH domain-containing protein 34-like [Durio zibethinus]|uniref:Zinc finger CCCH domain-containing protein 34-like n=1 Tax=Durio zibethinus TaxID=66656 RepID=A0A6P5XW31_DURZI|nr:zinc finger CCCH domain-containing protein 34-like [Durio zibethinus]
MEEELLKRNTDCVYFLASPLTCKKGIDCEYRHSEIARLNPRDCWYWLAGNCLNPTCGFRHPPLDGHAHVSSESAALSYQCSAPVNKTNLPCYFYFNGFCNKGGRCSFLHGLDDSAITGKSLQTDVLPLNHKKSIENDAVAAATETNPNPSKSVPNSSKDIGAQLKEDLQQSAPKTMIQMSVSPKTSVYEFGEAAFVKSHSLLLKEGITQSRSPLCADESSEEQMDDHVEPEDRWESSPGFDVLVDNKSKDLDYENDSEYLLAPDVEQRENFLSYDYEDSVQHETGYPNVEFPNYRDVYNAYEDSDNEDIFDNVRNPPAHRRDRRLGSIFFQKRRRLLPVELSTDEQIGVDLRDYLRKRRVIESNPLNCLSRRSEYSHLIGRSLERPQRCSMGRKLRGRLASKVGKHSIESMGDQGCFHTGTNRHGWLKHLGPNRSNRRLYREKRLPRRKSVSSEVSRNLISRERKSTDASTAFTGPKTLAQIKEEKRRTEENGGKMRHSIRTTSADFQSPKPLSEILKDKGRLDIVKDGHTSS